MRPIFTNSSWAWRMRPRIMWVLPSSNAVTGVCTMSYDVWKRMNAPS